jgi:CHAD domain-containing protein
MKLRLPLNRSIGSGLVALCAALTGEAVTQLDRLADDPIGSVHRARVALKRARSALRLLEKAGAAWTIMPRYRLTEAGGLMSVARENAVAASLARKLAGRLRGREREIARRLAGQKHRWVPPDMDQIRRTLLQEAHELAVAPAPVITPAQLRVLLHQSLDRARRRYYSAVMKPTLGTVHDWRKAVIVLRDQAAFAAVRWPQGAGLARPLLVRLARQLGRRGDLALLLRRLQHQRVPPALAPARQKFIARLQAQREQATLAAMLRWMRLEPRFNRLLPGKQ